MTTDPHWTAYLSALLTPVIAFLGSLIAYRQWRLAQNKLKFDLFERRSSVYEAARALMASIMTSGKAKDEELFKFMVGTSEAKWLFDGSVVEYLDKEIYSNAVDLMTLSAELEGVPVGDIRTKNVLRQAELKKWFNAQFKVLNEIFLPYLQLRH